MADVERRKAFHAVMQVLDKVIVVVFIVGWSINGFKLLHEVIYGLLKLIF